MMKLPEMACQFRVGNATISLGNKKITSSLRLPQIPEKMNLLGEKNQCLRFMRALGKRFDNGLQSG